ncbi:Inositol phosphorylceramide synthase catalytic subunit AUR1 [Brachionus plicatilis]|uniref:Inositol phosphorylceramide synthase catalytic subunit AUR1 n=1 Tax=Brachionus plicatilis TaxID=10195 RepID=A0A3M7QMI0_BRAPC|nr:Inositol phosphorylceramide synthase catalytic subunit AUR1 [Brachionus plicatilis]
MIKKILLLNYWVFIPILVYLILFFVNPLVQKLLHAKCSPNLIVDVDLWLFQNNIYFILSKVQNPVLDIISSIPYLFHFPLPLIYAIFLIRSKANIEDILRITLAYGLVNMIGVIIQYMVPTPPPWMVLMENKIPEANFHRVDNFLGIKIFKTIYSFSKLVCGAFPSLHTAWPSIILFGEVLWIGRWFCVLHVCLIAFSAVYSMHHYIIDVLTGILLAYISCKIANIVNFEKMDTRDYTLCTTDLFLIFISNRTTDSHVTFEE